MTFGNVWSPLLAATVGGEMADKTTELNEILSAPCATHELLDDVLRSWLYLVSTCRDRFLGYEDDVATCSEKLLTSPIFVDNKQYVRTQIIYSFLQEEEAGPLHIITSFLLLDGRSDEDVFRNMIDEGCFARLIDLINSHRDNDSRLRRLLLELTYEMSRIERVRTGDLLHVDDGLVSHLFQLIESPSDDAADPYHYSIIRVLVCRKPIHSWMALSFFLKKDLLPLQTKAFKLMATFTSWC